MKDEHNDNEMLTPTNRYWNKDSLEAWEQKVSKEIQKYLDKPCPYYGPDLDY